MEKKSLRTEILKIRDGLEEAQRHKNSTTITRKILETEEYQKAQMLLLFASFRSEVDTGMLTQKALSDGKEVYFPKIQKREDGSKEMEFYRVYSEEDLETGYYGIQEPREDSKSSLSRALAKEDIVFEDQFQTTIERQQMHVLVIIPGAVFDRQGNRIGYGGGFYDRYLHDLERMLENPQEKPVVTLHKMAIAFECQLVESNLIPVEPHDIKMDHLITEKSVYVCKAVKK